MIFIRFYGTKTRRRNHLVFRKLKVSKKKNLFYGMISFIVSTVTTKIIRNKLKKGEGFTRKRIKGHNLWTHDKNTSRKIINTLRKRMRQKFSNYVVDNIYFLDSECLQYTERFPVFEPISKWDPDLVTKRTRIISGNVHCSVSFSKREHIWGKFLLKYMYTYSLNII